MWIFLGLLFLLGFLTTAAKLSLISKRRNAALVAALLGGGVFVAHPLGINMSLRQIVHYLGQYSTLSAACVWQTAESILVMILALSLIRAHYDEGVGSRARLVAELPAFMFVAGAFALQLFLFDVLSGWGFLQVSLAASAATALVIWATSLLLRALLSHWEARLELLVMLSFLQLVVAMFLPILVLGMKLDRATTKLQLQPMVYTWLSLGLIVAAGYAYRQSRKAKIR